MDIKLILWIVFAAVVGSFPVVFIKRYIETNEFYLLFLSICFYILLIIGYLNVFKINGANVPFFLHALSLLSLEHM